MPKRFFSFSNVIIISAICIFSLYLYINRQSTSAYNYTAFINDLKAHRISSVIISGQHIKHIKYTDGTESDVYHPTQDMHNVMNRLLDANVQINVESPSNDFFYYWLFNFIPNILFIALLIYINLMRNPMNMLGSSKNSGEANKDITFKDVAGLQSVKRELMKIVQLTKHAKYFIKFGAKVPKGVLLSGPPGNGKTLLAKALANETNVKFIYISGSELVEVFVGLGASRVRQIFSDARENAPCIIFIDELDAIGRKRSTGNFSSGSASEQENTLNQILIEMDGFKHQENILVLGATNRAEILDPALLRPGRFDVKIQVPLPFSQERLEAFRLYLDKCKVNPDGLNLKQAVKDTAQLPSSTIASVINKAAVDAALEALEYNADIVKTLVEDTLHNDDQKEKILHDLMEKIDQIRQSERRMDMSQSDEDERRMDMSQPDKQNLDHNHVSHNTTMDSSDVEMTKEQMRSRKVSESEHDEYSDNQEACAVETDHGAELSSTTQCKIDHESIKHETHEQVQDNHNDQSIADIDTKMQSQHTHNAEHVQKLQQSIEDKINNSQIKTGYIQQKHLDNAIREMLIGTASSLVMSDEDRIRTAYHEAGHAIIAYHFGMSIIKEITITPTNNALGMVVTLPKGDDAVSYSRQWYEHRIAVALGGIKAEEKQYGMNDVSSGAISDIQHVTEIASRMVMAFCMHDDSAKLSYINYMPNEFYYDVRGNDVKNACDRAMHTLVSRIAIDVDNIFAEYYDRWQRLAKLLLELESITGDQLHVIMQNPTLEIEDLKAKFPQTIHDIPSEAKYIYMPALIH